MKKIVMLLAAVLCLSPARAQMVDRQHNTDPMVRNISMNTGLPGNSVRFVVQDKKGYMWFGTDNGICRYDGYNVQTFFNPEQSFDQEVSALEICDRGLLVGASKGLYLFNNETEHFQKIVEKIKSPVNHIAVDASQNVWVSTAGQGAFCYNLTTQECRQYPMKPFKGSVSCMLVDATSQVWAMSNVPGAGLYRLNKATDRFEPFRIQGDVPLFYGWAMMANADGSIMVGTWNQGVYQVFKDGRAKLLLSGSLPNCVHHVHKLYNYRDEQMFIGSDDGMVQYEPSSGRWLMLSETFDPGKSSTDRFIYGISSDAENGLWVGTFYGGVNYIPSLQYETRFRPYYARQGALMGSICGRFMEDEKHRIWIATDDAGLCCFDPATESYISFPGREAVDGMNVHALWAEGQDLWVGTYTNGVLKMNISTGAIQTYQVDGRMAGSSCFFLFRDSKNRFWATSMSGANILDEAQQKFKPVKSFDGLTIDIKEDSQGNVWFATQSSGLWCFRKNNTWKQYLPQKGDSTSIPSPIVNGLSRGSHGRLLVATNKGLCVYQPSTDNFQLVHVGATTENFACVISNQDELWISSDQGIIKYVPGQTTQMFNRLDGLTANQFLSNAGLMASDGRIYFGTTEGFNAFYPNQVKTNQVDPPVKITSVHLLGERLEVGSDKLPQSLDLIEKIDLAHDENVFSISFSALSYVSPEKNLYSYKLEGEDKDWVTTHNHRAAYANLSAGTYVFRVKATNNDGLWSKKEAKLVVEIHPPFWWSLPAKILYVMLIGYAIYWYTQSRVKREKRYHKHEMQRLEEKKEMEINEARLEFFTMIAHEIRTPVTLIIGPLEKLKERWKQMAAQVADSDAMNQTIDVIDRNTQRLLLLVNQLLDFNKVQQKGMQVHFSKQNISKMMHAVAERFEPTLQQKGAKLVVEYPDDEFAADIDGEAITKVISNLMSNATKYSNDYVRLTCSMAKDGEHFKIEVEDNGMGISQEEQEKIFSAFYQARDNKPGTGIGLNIVKKLVEAHHGMVEVLSEVGKGSTFIVTLPIHQAQELMEQEEGKNVLTVEQENGLETVDGNAETAEAPRKERRKVMLVVDDDEDMRNFIMDNFEKDFIVLLAEDGKQALHILQKRAVNVIVSDWMMPEIDGPEFCRIVRQDPNVCHLPFVMLTAKTDDKSKAEGMECGADIFIEKPFSMKYLEASVHHLIEMRHLLLSKFSHTPLEPIEEIAPTKTDDDFLERMSTIIEENLVNPELNVAFLAGKLGMSRSSLFNKIRGLAEVTPNEMIQLVRLKKAASLLREGNYRINEVSSMVGFSSSSYFAKCFYKQFGIKPAEFVEMESN